MSPQDILPRPMVIEEFTPLKGSLLRVDCRPENVDLLLVEVTGLPHRIATLRPPFELVFYSAPEIQLAPGIYVMRGREFGPAAIYLEQSVPPIGAEIGHYYLASFN